MFFLISKILSFLINPITWISALLLFSWLYKNEYFKQKFFRIAVILFFIFSNSFLFNEVMHAWEVPAVAVKTLMQYDLGIVLGTTSQYDAKLDRIQFIQSSDRLFQAIELYKMGKIKKIIYCGGSGRLLRPDEKEGVWIKRYLVLIGIPEQDILIENESRNTHENAAFTKAFLQPFNPNLKYLLITSASHMFRAVKCFEKQGIKVDAYSTDRMSGPRQFELGNLFIPSAYVMESWYSLNHELLGCIMYKLAGYI